MDVLIAILHMQIELSVITCDVLMLLDNLGVSYFNNLSIYECIYPDDIN